MSDQGIEILGATLRLAPDAYFVVDPAGDTVRLYLRVGGDELLIPVPRRAAEALAEDLTAKLGATSKVVPIRPRTAIPQDVA